MRISDWSSDVCSSDLDHPDLVIAKASLRKLLALNEDDGYVQPCLSPIWDTGLAAQALIEAGEDPDGNIVARSMDWLADRQILDTYGAWTHQIGRASCRERVGKYV